MAWGLTVLIRLIQIARNTVLLFSATWEKQGMGEGAIKDQEALGFVSFRQMNKDADALSVKNFMRMRQSGMPGSGHLAQHATSGQQEIFCLSLFLVILFKTNKQTKTPHYKTRFTMGIQNIFIFLMFSSLLFWKVSKLLGQCCVPVTLFSLLFKMHLVFCKPLRRDDPEQPDLLWAGVGLDHPWRSLST